MTTKGVIHLGGKVMVSDPCYGLNTWCQGVLENVLPGEYECRVEHSDMGDWGIRVSAIEVIHKDYRDIELTTVLEDFEVGVDSGQAGIFDYEYYARYHTDNAEREHVVNQWYDKCFDATLSRIENPNYEPFNWDEYGPINKLMNKDHIIDIFEKYDKYMQSDKRFPYVFKSDAGIMDGKGFVSSSGDGDGSYDCYTARVDNAIVYIRINYYGMYAEDYKGEEE
jgi:hypothetical protein